MIQFYTRRTIAHALMLILFAGCDALTHSGSHKSKNSVSEPAPVASPSQEPSKDPKASTMVGRTISQDQFFSVFEGKTLELTRKTLELDLKGCLLVSREPGKCRWQLKGTMGAKPVQLDFTGHCLIDPVSPQGHYQLDMIVSKIGIYDFPGETKITETVLTPSHAAYDRFSQNTIYTGELVFPLPSSPESVVSENAAPAILKWVSTCSL